MMRSVLLFLLMLVVIFPACNTTERTQDDVAVAKVGNKYLYLSDLPIMAGSIVSAADSARMQQTFIEKWVKKQLLLQKAELNLSEKDKDVTGQLEDYRESLLIYKYQQMLLRQDLDTAVTTEQVEKYFNDHSAGFVLNKPAFRGLFLQIRRPAPDLDKVRNWCRSDQPDAVKMLESYCFQNASRYEINPEKWMSLESVQTYFPSKSGFGDWVLRSYKLYEYQDTTSVYLLAIKDYRLAGSPTPIELVEDNIRSILLNKRKIDFLNKTENDLYSNAVSRDQVEYFNTQPAKK